MSGSNHARQRACGRGGPARLQPALAGFALLALLTGCRAAAPRLTQAPPPTPIPSAAPTEAAGVSGFKVVGYVLDGVVVADDVPYDSLTHINYAFLIPKDDGGVGPMYSPRELARLAAMAHQHGVKVLLSVGGWGHARRFERLAGSPASTARFIGELVGHVDRYGLDGVDIDWEYPQAGKQAQDFAALMRELGAAMHGKGKLLTAAVAALGPHADPILPEVFSHVDFLNIMAYDGPGEHHSPYSYAQEALEYWLGRGLPPAKAVLGVPFYGRPGEAPYARLVNASATAPYTDRIEFRGLLVYYNGLDAVQEKTRLAHERAGGIMIWALSYDTGDGTSLLGAIHQAAHGQAPGP